MDWNAALTYNDTHTSPDDQVTATAHCQTTLGLAVDGKHGPATREAIALAHQAPADRLAHMVQSACDQDGKPYVFGAEVDLDDPDPEAFDCSELCQWAAHQAGLNLPDGSWKQVQHCREKLTLVSVDVATRTHGALLFRFGSDPFGPDRPSSAHVAISLGDGRTFEARSSSHGVGYFSAEGRGWTHAGLVPGETGDLEQVFLGLAAQARAGEIRGVGIVIQGTDESLRVISAGNPDLAVLHLGTCQLAAELLGQSLEP